MFVFDKTKANLNLEITNKMHEVRKTWYKMREYWKAKDASKKWQLIIHDAVIRSKLLYGLHSAALNTGDIKKLDAFQLKGFRQILKWETTYVNKDNTNER